jgi:TRAP transporter 4TM/12TM fusion protein
MMKYVEQEAELPESGVVRLVSATLGVIVTLLCLAWAAGIYRRLGIVFLTEQLLALVLGLSMAIVFVVRPLRGGGDFRRRLPWYDAAAAAASIVAGLYVAVEYPRMLDDFFRPDPVPLAATWIIFVLAIEALRRAGGLFLMLTVLVFVGYALVGHLVGGDLQTRPVQLNRMIYYLGIDTGGILGLVLLIAVTVVIPFIFFGQLLSSSGGATFFNDISIALMGRFRGGAAKITILSSSLFGTINGIVVANILTSGVVTIPMMKKSGFSAEQAAGFEASSSNGGQLMPPVMGAVAFLMADFLQVPYAEVALAATIPSILYYVALLIQADLESAKANILAIPVSQIPRTMKVLAQGWSVVLPFVVMIYALFTLKVEAEVSAILASIAIMIVGFLFGYGTQRLTLREVWMCVVRSGVSSADILIISAASGIIMGVLQLTGLGFALTMLLVKLGAGNLFLLLVIAAFLCILLGMGMPTLGVYVLLAVLIVPALVEVGVQPMAAHMFILYLGMMSFVTPPVAIAAFFAANLAGADPMKTGWVSMQLSWTAYIVPFLFVFEPALLMQGSIGAIVYAVAITSVGIWFVSAGIIGFGLRRMPPPARIASVLAGAGLLLPHTLGTWAWVVNAAALALALFVLAREYVNRPPVPLAAE